MQVFYSRYTGVQHEQMETQSASELSEKVGYTPVNTERRVERCQNVVFIKWQLLLHGLITFFANQSSHLFCRSPRSWILVPISCLRRLLTGLMTPGYQCTMKFLRLVLSFYLAGTAASSPLSNPGEAENIVSRPPGFRDATPDEIFRVFGFHTFQEFLASAVSERSDAPTTVFRRATQSVCQRTAALYDDAYLAIVRLAELPASTNCGNSQTPPGCSIMASYKTARVGFCGPRTTNIKCSLAAKYLYGIATTCRYSIVSPIGGTILRTGGYQSLNENPINYVFVERDPEYHSWFWSRYPKVWWLRVFHYMVIWNRPSRHQSIMKSMGCNSDVFVPLTVLSLQ